MTILLVDDEPVALRLLQFALERDGYRVAMAASAADALAWLGEAHGVELVITDQNLGAMTGLELLATLRQDVRWRGLPAILCTAAADRATVEAAIRVGVRHFIVKPVRPPKLLESVERALAERTATLPNRYDAQEALGMSEPAYRSFLRTSRARLATLQQEFVEARAFGLDRTHDVVRRIREPADVLGARRLVAAVDDVMRAGPADPLDLLLDLVTIELACLDEVLDIAQRPPLPGRTT